MKEEGWRERERERRRENGQEGGGPRALMSHQTWVNAKGEELIP